MSNHYIAWWNVENLFDSEKSEKRSDKLRRTLKSELKGWTESVLDKKLGQLSKIISKMNDGKGPDILGVCEVENESVLQKLVNKISINNRDYDFAHEDTKDSRGIDIAFLFDKNRYEATKVFSHFIQKRNATRDIFQTNLSIKGTKKEIILIGNHWPARLGGEMSSEPYRMMAGENLAYFVERIQEVKGIYAPIVICGDFNDEPSDRSITEYARSTRVLAKARSARSKRLFNMMWEEMGQGKASHFYDGYPNMLDQFMVTKGLLSQKAKIKIKEKSAKILDFDEMKKRSGEPRRFSRPGKRDYDPGGFSDHFPIAIILID